MECPVEESLIDFATTGWATPSLRAHVETCEACRAAVAMVAGLDDQEDDDAPTEMYAGRYRLGELLGTGGLGMVVAAHDTLLEMDIAMKLLRPELSGLMAMLEREVRLARAVRHPNICTVFDLGVADGRRFITMERVDGVGLDAWVEAEAPGPSARRTVFAGIVDGVAAAHAQAVIHRDLKPSNIMIDAAGRAKVMDFGLALDVEEGVEERRIAGTPEWWAPEQAWGEAVAPHTDVFALGAIARWLLVDPSPHEARWIERCTRLDPAERFPDAGSLRQAMNRRRRWPLLAAIATVALLAVVAAWWLLPRGFDRTASGEEAYRQGRQAIAQQRFWAGVEMLELATMVDATDAEAQLWLGYAYDWLGQGPKARAAVDEALLRVDQLTDADRLFLLAIEAKLRHDEPRATVLSKRLLALEPTHGDARFMVGDLAYHAGRFEEAVTLLAPVVASQPGIVRARHHLLWARFAAGDLAGAQQLAETWAGEPEHREGAIRLAEVRVALGHPDAAATVEQLHADGLAHIPVVPTLSAVLALQAGDPAAAATSLRAQLERTSADRFAARAEWWRRLGWTGLATGRLTEARAAYRQALEVLGKVTDGVARGRRAQYRSELAWGRAVSGDPGALAALQTATAAPDTRDDRIASFNTAQGCLIVDDLPCSEALRGVDWPEVAPLMRAHQLIARGLPEQALPILEDAARRQVPMLAPASWLVVAIVARNAGDSARADRAFSEATAHAFPTPQSMIPQAVVAGRLQLAPR